MEIISKLTNIGWWQNKCVDDLYFFSRNVLQTLEDPTPGFKDLYYPTHKLMCDFVQKYATEGQKVVILTPRGWIKSYLITVGWSLQRMVKNWILGKREHEIISNATLPNAKEFLEKIKYNIKYNELFNRLFDKYIPKDVDNEAERWTQDEIQLKGNKIETGSVEGNLVSRHYKIMIHDDLVNRDNSETALQLSKTIDWWKLAQSLLLPDGIEILIGTRWNFDDLYGHMIDTFIRPKKDYSKGRPITTIHRGSYHLLQMDCWSDVENEKGSTFPVMFPEEKLKKIQSEQGDRFGGQYRNDPLAKGKNPFKREWIQKYSLNDIPKIIITIMLVDPSGKAKSQESSYSGMTIIDCAVDKKGYIRFGKRRLITDLKLAEWMIEKALEFQPSIIGIEDTKFNAIQETLEIIVPQDIKFGKIPEHLVKYAKTIPYIMTELKPRGRPKPVRIKNLASSIESGRFLFPRFGTEELEDEIVRFPASKKDDILDAFAYILDILVFPKPTDPEKRLIVPENLKKTTEQLIREDWERAKEYVTAGQERGFKGIKDLY